ncbi:MAG: PaaI family thioesterase [Myxococcales bacterium]|nr:PaaI family thioesterase [Polyangiaceae bacterium]MDW8248994.1 PaaI family thioesterase [Myxococcales bacterium]
MKEARISAHDFEELVRATIPLAREMSFSVREIVYGEATVRLEYDNTQLRAGGTLNGPTMMTLADTALYAAVLSCIGREPLAVTSNLSIHFLKRPAPRPLVARAKILRLGKRLAVGTVEIQSEGEEDLVAHASGTYALPGAR